MSLGLSIELPLVSVVIPCYNREHTIGKAIESVLAQDYPNLEIIISDNCSTDSTRDIIARYTSDSRVRFSQNEQNVGMIENFRLSIVQKAKGEYFSILSSDDEYVNPKFISHGMELIRKYENVVLVKAGSYHKKGNTGKYHTYKQNKEFENGAAYFRRFEFSEDFGWTGVLIKREYIDRYKLLDRQVVSVDYFINLQLCLMGNVAFLKETSYQFNLHDSNSSSESYSFPQIDEVIESQHQLFRYALANNVMSVDELSEIRERYEYCFIANVLEDYYKNNREQLSAAEDKMRSLNNELVNSFYKSKRWRLWVIVFYNHNLGNIIINIKWKLTNFFR